MCILKYKRALLGLGFVTVLANIATGQNVVGTVRDSASQQPLRGAVVSLLDSTGHVSSRTLTTTDGRYRLGSVGAVRRIQIVRIGFRPLAIALPAGIRAADTTIDVTMSALPTLLETVNVVDQPGCPRRSDRAAALALWEQTRAGLLASVVAREAAPARITTLLYDRTLDIRGRSIQWQTVAESTFTSSRSSVSERSASEFAAYGYVEDDSVHRRYFAPDADVLLDPVFAETHCFEIHTGEGDHERQIGLGFVPAPGREALPEITGVLWVERAMPSLRSLEFKFTGLEPASIAVHAGGELLFREMANGVVVTERWNLHVSYVSASVSPLVLRLPLRERISRRVLSMHDVGAQLEDATWRDGTHWHAPLGTVSGVILSAGDATPVSDLTVRLDRTALQTKTDSAGRFTFSNVLPGPYTVSAADSTLAVVGIAQTTHAEVVVARDTTSEVKLVLPKRAAAIAALCSDSTVPNANSGRSGGVLLIGHVLRQDGIPASNATVRMGWIPQNGADANRQLTFGGSTDSVGTFALCGMPAGTPIAFQAWRDSLISGDTMVTLGSRSPVATVELVVGAPILSNLPAYRRRSVDVVEPASGVPVEGVEVSDPMSGRVLGHTSSAGTVSLASLPEGPSVLQLRKVGYPRRTFLVSVVPTDTMPVKVLFSSGTQLAPMVTAADAVRSSQALRSGYESRKAKGIGRFIDSEELRKAEDRLLSDLLVKLGLRPVNRRGAIFLAGGHGFAQAGPALSRPSAGAECFVTVYMDGGILFDGRRGTDPPDFRMMSASDFAAVEYYASPAETPIEYAATESACGTVVLWTRQ